MAQTIGLAGSEIRRALVQVQETIALIAGMSEQLRRAFADAGS